MKIYNIEQRSPEWFAIRSGRITGTGLKKLVSTRKDTRDDYFYEVLAGRLTTELDDTETALARGVRLEEEALNKFQEETKIEIEKAGFCQSDANEWIGYSPDGLIKSGKIYSEDIEIKCPANKNHLRIWLENTIPEEYEAQIIQAFIVNEKLKKRYFASYDPRITIHPIHIIEANRTDYEEKIELYKEAQLKFIEMVNAKLEEINKL
jgi:putative phage-type endonuclease